MGAYKQEVLEFITERDTKFRATGAQIFPEAYASTVDQGVSRKLPYLEKWIAAYPLLIGVWLAAGWALWAGLTSRLEPVIEKILGNL